MINCQLFLDQRGAELYKVSARNRSYIKPDLRPIDWARAAVELLNR